MKLVEEKSPILKQSTEEFDFSDETFDAVEFSQKMVDLLLEMDGLGLAAPQVGLSMRFPWVGVGPPHHSPEGARSTTAGARTGAIDPRHGVACMVNVQHLKIDVARTGLSGALRPLT